MRRTAPTLLALTLAAATAALGAGVPARAATPAPALVRLTSAADDLAGYTDLGALPAATRVQTALVLADPNVAGEDRLLADQEAGTVGYVTPAAYEAAFAVPQATFAAARSFATAHGLTASFASGDRDYLLLSGTAAQTERTFSVGLDRYRVPGSAKTYYASAADPLVPADLDIAGVLGLDDMRGAHTFIGDQGGCVAGTCVGALNIDDFTAPYDLPAAYTGQGQKIGIFGEGDYKQVLSDLRVFEKDFDRPQISTRVVNVGDNQSSTDGTDEWDLDTQSSSGIAVGASQLDLYFGQDLSDASINASYAAWASDPAGPHQMNASFGECAPVANGFSTPTVPLPEVGGVAVGTQSVAAYNAQEAQLREARAEGRTLFASAGDQGGSCGIGIPNAFENNVLPELNVPAGSVNAVGVGGTDLTTDQTTGARVTETSANAAGGGSSLSIPADAYQDGITVSLPQRPLADCVVTQAGTPLVGGPLCRSLPDIAAECGNLAIEAGESGLNIYTGGQVQPVAGTSLSSPLSMGMWARIQSSDTNPAGYGFANLTIYRLGKEQQAGQTSTPSASAAPTSASPTPSSSTPSSVTTSVSPGGTATTTAASASPTGTASSQGVARALAVAGSSATGSTSPTTSATTTTTTTASASGSVTPTATTTTTVTTTTAPATLLNPFYDVTLGTNDQQVAATGYDQASGWGVFDVAHVIADLPRTSTAVFVAVPPSVAGDAGAAGGGAGGSLAFTGLTQGLPIAAVVLLGAGGGLWVVRRRRAAAAR